jgi:hypothetical protein
VKSKVQGVTNNMSTKKQWMMMHPKNMVNHPKSMDEIQCARCGKQRHPRRLQKPRSIAKLNGTSTQSVSGAVAITTPKEVHKESECSDVE